MPVPTKKSGSDKSSDQNEKGRNQGFGDRFKEFRNKCGLTQTQLAQKIGVNVYTVQRYELGYLPKGDIFLALSESLGCSIDWLLRGVEKKSEQESRLQGDLLRTIIRAIENELQKRDLELEPDKKAEAIALLYEMYADTKKEVTEQTVVRYLKLVA